MHYSLITVPPPPSLPRSSLPPLYLASWTLSLQLLLPYIKKTNRKKEKGKSTRNRQTHIHKTHKNTKLEAITYKQRTSKVRHAQTKQYEILKNLQKHHWVHFVFPIYYWTWSLPLSLVNIPNKTPLETIFFLCKQLSVMSFTFIHIFTNSWSPFFF